MVEIIIEHDFTTQNDIENCIKVFNAMTGIDDNLQITFTQQIQEIDILLVAYLTIFKELKPQIEITIKLNGNDGDNNELTSKLFQYLIYGFLMTGKSVFKIFQNRTNTIGLTVSESSPPNIFHRNFVLSKSFMPILLVGKLPDRNGVDLFDLLFNEKIDGLCELPKEVDSNSISDNQYDNLNRWIKGYLDNDNKQWVPGKINPSDRIECIRYLARLAFYNTLKQSRIASFYFSQNEEEWKTMNISHIPYSKTDKGIYPHIEFFKEIKWIFDDLSFQPPIYHFVFSQLLSSELLPGEFNGKNKGIVIGILHSLWDYTKEMVDGIRELAKNIREHATPPIGAITGRIYKEEKWAELKMSVESIDSIFDDYLKNFKKKNSTDKGLTFFDFNVIDLGEKGIIETLKEKTNKLSGDEYLNESVRSLILEDVNALSSGAIDLKHFLNPSIGITLNLQSKKAIAHLGLLIFSNLIKTNNGLLRAGSLGCEPFLTYHCTTSDEANPVPFGTNYHVVLPISTDRKIKTLLPHPLNIPLESAPVEIKGIEELLDYEIKKLNGDEASIDDTPENTKFIYLISIEKTEIESREKEFERWEKANKLIEKNIEKDDQKKNIMCLDFENSEINESNLFRILGLWSLNYPSTKLIIINIPISVFKKLIKANEYFFEKLSKFTENISDNDNSIYWNEKSPMLLYSYCNPRNNEERFYFTDILWGKEKQDFYHANQLIKRTNFNATAILLQNDKNQKYDDNRLSFIAQSGFFYSKTTLLPFDLLLPGKNELTLFEHNASVLLQNELKIQDNNNNEINE